MQFYRPLGVMLFATGLEKRTRLLLLCGPISCIMSVTVVLVLGGLTQDYSALRHPVSSLVLANAGWIQQLNFIISGLLIFAFAFGLRQAMPYIKGANLTCIILGIAGLGLVGAGLCSTDPVYGYPSDQPLVLSQYSTEGKFHEFFSLLAFIGIPIACFRFRRRFKLANDHLWATYTSLTALAIIAGLILSTMGFKQTDGLVNAAGFFQRFSIVIGSTWLTLLSFYILKTARWNERVMRTPFHPSEKLLHRN